MTTTQITVTKSEHISEGVESYDFGCRDATKAKRSVGCKVAYATIIIVGGLAPGSTTRLALDYPTRTHLADGTYYAWRGYATRDGEAFGPSQSWHYLGTEAQRQAEVDKYLKGAASRAKKFAA